MARVRQKGPDARLSLRKELHIRGLRYRLQVQLLNKPHGIADIIFTGTKVAVFVDGRFWHGRPEHASWQKIIRNFGAERSKPIELGTPNINQCLNASGWRVFRVAGARIETIVLGGSGIQ